VNAATCSHAPNEGVASSRAERMMLQTCSSLGGCSCRRPGPREIPRRANGLVRTILPAFADAASLNIARSAGTVGAIARSASEPLGDNSVIDLADRPRAVHGHKPLRPLAIMDIRGLLIIAKRSARSASASARSAEQTAQSAAESATASTAVAQAAEQQLAVAREEQRCLEAERARTPRVREITPSEIESRPGPRGAGKDDPHWLHEQR
jgi:hypothetical protein